MGKLNLAEVMSKSVSKIVPFEQERIQYVELDRLAESPRNFYSMDGLDELAENIRLVGLQQPLRVRAINPGDKAQTGYEIVSGHRRRAALRLLAAQNYERWHMAPCIVERGDDSEAMRELKLIAANLNTRQRSDAEIAREAEKITALLRQLRDEGLPFEGRTVEGVAELLGISPTKVKTLQATRRRLIPELAEMWERGEINTAKAARLAKEDADTQGHLADNAYETVKNGTEAEIDGICKKRDNMKAEQKRPEWKTGTPPWDGLYYAALEYEKNDVVERVLLWSAGRWKYKDGQEVWEGYKVPRWYPLPED